MTILVTGGAGYIGSHTVLALLEAGHEVVVLDNFSNSSEESLCRVRSIANRSLIVINGDIRDEDLLCKLFSEYQVQSVLHFAGLKAVGESNLCPIDYYDNNFSGTIALCRAMQISKVYKLVFSSSATVYGANHSMPLSENLTVSFPDNPYGRSKLMVEKLLQDVVKSDARWSVSVLRYFNPAGAHPSGLIGEDPHGIPNNLLPYIAQVAVGRRERVSVYGYDYPTPDGTGVRDYIHVMDLADGHLMALDALGNLNGFNVWNLGTGKGYSVLEVLKAFEKASHKSIPFRFEPRRCGDISQCWADPTKAEKELGWKAQRGLDDMMVDAWRWQRNNPYGFSDS